MDKGSHLLTFAEIEWIPVATIKGANIKHSLKRDRHHNVHGNKERRMGVAEGRPTRPDLTKLVITHSCTTGDLSLGLSKLVHPCLQAGFTSPLQPL